MGECVVLLLWCQRLDGRKYHRRRHCLWTLRAVIFTSAEERKRERESWEEGGRERQREAEAESAPLPQRRGIVAEQNACKGMPRYSGEKGKAPSATTTSTLKQLLIVLNIINWFRCLFPPSDKCTAFSYAPQFHRKLRTKDQIL